VFSKSVCPGSCEHSSWLQEIEYNHGVWPFRSPVDGIFTLWMNNWTINRSRTVIDNDSILEIKVKVLRNTLGSSKGGRGMALHSLDLGVRRGGWWAPRPGRFTPGKYPVPIVQEVGWAPGPIWTCAKNLAPTGVGSPDRPACSQSPLQKGGLKIRQTICYVEIDQQIH
jgi:hypothetical protein